MLFTLDSTRTNRGLAILVVAAASAVVASASPALADASPHHVTKHHHHHHAGQHHRHHPARHQHHQKSAFKRVTVDGLVTAVHQRHVTVFATAVKIGRHTTHNSVVHVVLSKNSMRHRQIRKGYSLHLVAAGKGSTKHLVVHKVQKAHLEGSPATVFVGIVKRAASGGLLLQQFSRDNGEHGDTNGRHPLGVDTSEAKVLVDGVPGKVHAGDLVAVLGEIDGDYVLASRVFAVSGEAETVRGVVTSIDGDAVTVRGDGFDQTISLGSGDTEVPLFLNGAAGSADQLRVHDRIVVVGVVSEEEEGFLPLLGFAFDGNDDGPCGDNPEPRHHRR